MELCEHFSVCERRDYCRDADCADYLPRRPKGKWINNECPFCGRYENYPENFCATCGADLRGEL